MKREKGERERGERERERSVMATHPKLNQCCNLI